MPQKHWEKTHKNSDMSILESDKVLFKVGSKRHKGHFIKIKRSIQLLVKSENVALENQPDISCHYQTIF